MLSCPPPPRVRVFVARERVDLRKGFDGLLFDVEANDLWLGSWGAPPLIPVVGHRYLLGHPLEARSPLLSTHESDVVVDGASLQRDLMPELGPELGLS